MRLLILFFLLILAGCNTTRKAQKSAQAQRRQQSASQTQATKAEALKQNDQVTNWETTTVKIEYAEPVQSEPKPAGEPAQEKQKAKESPGPTTQKRGAIKSITTTTTRATVQDKGSLKTSEQTDTKSQSQATQTSQSSTETEEKPAPDPKRWRYIFGILVIVSLLGLWLYRQWESIKAFARPFFKRTTIN